MAKHLPRLALLSSSVAKCATTYVIVFGLQAMFDASELITQCEVVSLAVCATCTSKENRELLCTRSLSRSRGGRE